MRTPTGHDGRADSFLALRSVGLVMSPPVQASAVVVLPPVVDTTGMSAGGRGGRPPRVTSLVATRQRLLDQLADRAHGVGVVGLVGVDFAETPFISRSTGVTGTVLEVRATAWPVRTSTAVRSDAFFRTALSPADVTTLLLAGWVPVDVLLAGTALARAYRHRTGDIRASGALTNSEIPGATDMIQRARRQLRESFRRSAVALGADGLLLHGNFTTAWSSTQHFVEVHAVANAITQFRKRSVGACQGLPLSN